MFGMYPFRQLYADGGYPGPLFRSLFTQARGVLKKKRAA